MESGTVGTVVSRWRGEPGGFSRGGVCTGGSSEGAEEAEVWRGARCFETPILALLIFS